VRGNEEENRRLKRKKEEEEEEEEGRCVLLWRDEAAQQKVSCTLKEITCRIYLIKSS